MLGLMLITALFSMWMSNTATTAMMMTLVAPMLAQLPPGEPFRKALALAVPVAANIGGIGTPIASPPNAVAIGFLQKAGLHIGFLDWMFVAVPLLLGLLLFSWEMLWRFHRPADADIRIAQTPQRLNRRGWFVVGVFVVTVLLWLTDRWHGLPAAVVALLPAVAFTASGILDRTDVNSLDWHILILIAGGISLGAGMQLTGLDDFVAQTLPRAGGIWLLAVLVVATIGLGTFMSNTAAANLLLPIGISAATVAGASGGPSAVQAALCIAMAASLSMALPVSTPPNAIAYAQGEFSTRDLARVGLLVGLAGAILLIVGSGRGAALVENLVSRGGSRFPEMKTEQFLERGGVGDGDAVAAHRQEFLFAEFCQRARKRFARRAHLGGEDAFGAIELDGLRRFGEGTAAAFQEPVREALLGVFQSEIVDQPDDDAQMLAHGTEHAERELGAFAQESTKSVFGTSRTELSTMARASAG